MSILDMFGLDLICFTLTHVLQDILAFLILYIRYVFENN